MNEIIATTYEDLNRALMQIGRDGFCCFRGQSDAGWRLVPGIYRELERATPPIGRDDGVWIGRIERDTYRTFRDNARIVVPEIGDDWDLLCLAQHYGTPTRLLDWTTNFWVATYFAVMDDRDSDAAIWCVNVDSVSFSPALSRRAFRRGHRIDNIKAAISQREVSFFQPVTESHETEVLAGGAGFFVIFEPPRIDGRILNQDGLFTLYVGFDDKDFEWDHGELLSRPSGNDGATVVSKIVVPRAARSMVRDDITRFSGINPYRVFPDLTGLGGLLSVEKRRAYALQLLQRRGQ